MQILSIKNHRRRLALLSVFCMLVGFGLDGKAAEQGKRPNILFAFADDWGRYAISWLQAGLPSSRFLRFLLSIHLNQEPTKTEPPKQIAIH